MMNVHNPLVIAVGNDAEITSSVFDVHRMIDRHIAGMTDEGHAT